MTVLLAVLWDRLLGEPDERWHPVVLMGRYLTYVGRRTTRLSSPAHQYLAGTTGWLLGAVGTAGIAIALNRLVAQRLPRPLRPPVGAALLKPLFAHRLLLDEVASVDRELHRSLDYGRHQVARIVGRETSLLSEREVRKAALESLAENFSDSVVAPLMWYSIAGIPGAALYRYVNTADAMWGYRGTWEWAGKTAAIADDIANYVPARVAAALIVDRASCRVLAREARKTRSPNAGWPMAAMALRCNVRLGNPETHDLHPSGREMTSTDLADGAARINQTAWIVFVAAAVTSWVIRRD